MPEQKVRGAEAKEARWPWRSPASRPAERSVVGRGLGLFVALVLAGCANPAAAPSAKTPAEQPSNPASQSPATQMNAIKLFQAAISFPQPIWVHGGTDPRSVSELTRQGGGPIYMLGFAPKGETFEKWTKVYVLLAVHAADLTFDTHVGRTLAAWVGACGKENLTVANRVSRPDFFQAVVICQNSPHGDPNLGYGDGVGEVAIVQVSKVEDTYISIWHSWRGKSFTAPAPENWPVPVDEVKEMLQRFQTIQVVPAASVDLPPATGDAPPPPPAPPAPKR